MYNCVKQVANIKYNIIYIIKLSNQILSTMRNTICKRERGEQKMQKGL